jgi:hypothetical protein
VTVDRNLAPLEFRARPRIQKKKKETKKVKSNHCTVEHKQSMSERENDNLDTLCLAADMLRKDPPVVKIVSAHHGRARKGQGSRTLTSSDSIDVDKYVDDKKTQVLSFPDSDEESVDSVCREIIRAATEHATEFNGFTVWENSVSVPVVCVSLGDERVVSKAWVTVSMRDGQFTKLAPEKFEKLRIMDTLRCDQSMETSLDVLVCGFQELECCLILPYRAHIRFATHTTSWSD